MIMHFMCYKRSCICVLFKCFELFRASNKIPFRSQIHLAHSQKQYDQLDSIRDRPYV
jgi:hypothetical protein